MGDSPTTSSRSRRSSRPGRRGSCRTTGCRSTSSSTASRSSRSASATTSRSSPACSAKKLGYDGVVVTDWELVNDNHVGEQVLPARAWGVEHLDPARPMELILEAGADQFGGEECVDILLDLVAQGRVTEARVDESARRLLAVKFRLGLFDDPYVDEDAAAATVGPRGLPRRRGMPPRPDSVTVLAQRARCRSPLPLAAGLRIYAERRHARGGRAARPARSSGRRTPTSRSCGSWRRSTRARTSSWSRGSTRARSTSRPASSLGCERIAAHARSSSTSCSTGRPW